MSANPAARIEVQEIPIDACIIEHEYQRTRIRKKLVDRIATAYRVELDEPIAVAPVGQGRYAILDGQHRWLGKKRRGHDTISCRVMPRRTFKQRAGVFADINTERNALSPLELFKGEYEAGEGDAVALVEALAAAGYKVSGLDGDGSPIACVNTLRKMQSLHGDALVTDTMSAVRDAWGKTREGVKAYYINGIAEFLRLYAGRYDRERLVRKLSEVQPAMLRARGAQLADFSGPQGRVNGMCRAIVQVYNAHLAAENRLPMN